jgi:hypothetical protein
MLHSFRMCDLILAIRNKADTLSGFAVKVRNLLRRYQPTAAQIFLDLRFMARLDGEIDFALTRTCCDVRPPVGGVGHLVIVPPLSM